MRDVLVVAAASSSVVVGKGGSQWTLANVVCVVVGRQGGGFRVAIGGLMERHRWTTLFAFGARRRLGQHAKLGGRVIGNRSVEKLPENHVEC
jgi:hypothetical protein